MSTAGGAPEEEMWWPRTAQNRGRRGPHFQGQRFYITDYRSEGYKQRARKESDSAKPASPATSDKAAKADAKPDAKPAAKSAAKK